METVLPMARTDQNPSEHNWLLAALPAKDRQQLLRQGEQVSLTREQPLLQAQQASSTVYFPAGGVVSLVASTSHGEISEVATIGRDGMVGMPAFLGDGVAPWDVHCQIPGEALRVPSETLGSVVTATPAVREVLGRYAQVLLVQIARNATCNQLHPMLQRCSRWILLIRRQSGRDQFPLTQQTLATMLGVRRATVTVTAGELQKAGAIGYHHGSMRITDPAVLQELACDCYSAIEEAYDRLLPVKATR